MAWWLRSGALALALQALSVHAAPQKAVFTSDVSTTPSSLEYETSVDR